MGWPRGARFRCAGCGRFFGGLTAFDRHQTESDQPPRYTTCHNPADRGLVDRSGVWGRPAPVLPKNATPVAKSRKAAA
jgi:hypothetical protein